jgi:glycosyltransferase involved in cell wall biosynthesis
MYLSPHIVNRTRDWWKPKAGNILAVLYLAALQYQLEAQDFVIALIPAILTILGIGMFTYCVNDWVDLPTDRLLNKKNMFLQLSAPKQVILVLFSLVAATVPWMYLPKSALTFYLLGLQFLLILAYSLPPIRLKTKGVFGVVADAAYAYATPSLLAFHTFSLFAFHHPNEMGLSFLLLFLWQLFAGLYNVSIHQLEDYTNDRTSKTYTWAIRLGQSKLKWVMLCVFWPSMILFFFAFLFSLQEGKSMIILFVGVYLSVKLFNVFIQKKPKSFFASPFTEDFQRINLHYHSFLPFIVFVVLIQNNSDYLYLGLIHLLFFSYRNLRSVWFISKKLFFTYVVQPVHYYFAQLVHHFRRKGKSDGTSDSSKTVPQNFSVAVINRNKDKYTETFVKARIEALKEAGYTVHFLYGDDLPTESEDKGTLLSNYATIRFAKQWFYSFTDKPLRSLYEKSLRSYLLNNNIQLVFAEFGTVGVEVAPICSSLNIPYVITFYGYDFHHQTTFRSNQQEYIDALNGARGIIGVSKEITAAIQTIVEDPDNVKYLPCMVNISLFRAVNRNPIAHQFLSIGRFAETKAPHLTILAFSEVVKTLPLARLIMIGKDGGGELFESCIILAKALGVDQSIDFKGIRSPLEISEIMSSTAVFVQHSLTTPLNGDKEGTPVSVMEAMCAGLPIVATRHAGIQDLITHEETGLLVNEYDWKSMAEEMIRLATNQEFSRKLGRNARNRVLSDELIANGKLSFLDHVNEIRKKLNAENAG